ncbi:hypothetical protein [Acinetobacter sp. AG3]|jgi:hypothetical protein|uniref:hypothetical protein n=3 Tax=unclassified Acinetobacter TaxID=196816 RepID=UPI001EEFEC2A|nr:hypothetical protein [Acinetobacter sp. AG3]MCG7220626.1 hypothetical protein [Acinetobacter sp. AG3]
MTVQNPENQAFWKKIASRSTDIQQQFWYGAEKLAKYIHDNPANYLSYREYDTSKPDPNLPWWRKMAFYQGQAAINEGVTSHNTAVALVESSSWIWGMLKGDFNKSPTMSQVIVSGLVSMIPLVDQVCDIRDLIANLIDLSEENGKTKENYMALALTAFGVIPEIGSAIKTIVKAVKVKGVTKISIIKTMEGFESIFTKLKIKSPWGKSPETWLRSKPWKTMGTRAFDALKNCIDRLLKAINGLLETVSGSLKSLLEKFKTGITNAKNSIKKYIDEFCENIQNLFHNILPQKQLGMAGGNGHNIPTNRYETNVQSGKTTSSTHRQSEHTPEKNKPPKDKDIDDPCALKPYYPDTCKPFGKTGHHVVPDRAFRYGKRNETDKRISGAISENNGLVVCVTGAGKQLQHGQIHAYYDKKERILGRTSTPKGVTDLWKLEYFAAVSVSKILKCDRTKMLAKLRAYHQLMGMNEDFKVRADPSGKMTIDKTHLGAKVGTNMNNGGKKL